MIDFEYAEAYHRSYAVQLSGHETLDAIGCLPLVGEPVDCVNGVWYFAEGDKTNGSLSMSSMLPVAGWGGVIAKHGDEVLEFAGKNIDEGLDAVKGTGKLRYVLKNTDVDLRGTGTLFDDALDTAFKNTGLNKSDFNVTKWSKNKYGKSFPVEWRAANGAEVSVDFAYYNVDVNGNWITGPDAPHIGWQTGGKRSGGGAVRGHILVDEVPYGR